MSGLTKPFPWFGGKGRWAEEIRGRMGPVTVYAEPFGGSFAVLLASEPVAREIVCDTDGMICNCYRAIQCDPEQVAHWADYPTIHQDLTARRYWLREWRNQHAEVLSRDPEFHDPKAAGWWLYCISSWIGPATDMLGRLDKDKVPLVSSNGGGSGVQAGRINLGGKIPKVSAKNGGTGVQAQRLYDQIPHVSGKDSGGQGVSAQRVHLGDQIPKVHDWAGGQGVQAHRRTLEGDGPGRLLPWFEALSRRLKGVIVLNRDWRSALSPTMLQHTPSGPKPLVGVFLDPPYRMGGRTALYDSDEIDGDDPAVAAYQWAVEHGGLYRIAYSCRRQDFDLPLGWGMSESVKTFMGQHDPEVRARDREVVYFSPACTPPKGVQAVML